MSGPYTQAASDLRLLAEELTAAADAASADIRRAGRTDIESENAAWAAVYRLRAGALRAIRIADQLDSE